MNAANPLQTAILVERVSDKNRGIANSILQTTWMLGTAGMGPVQAYLVTTYGNYWGYAITFSMTGVFYILSSSSITECSEKSARPRASFYKTRQARKQNHDTIKAGASKRTLNVIG